MSSEKFVEACEPYWKDGLMSVKLPWEGVDNHMLFGSTFFWVYTRLAKDPTYLPVVAIDFAARIRERCVEPGLYNSFPSWAGKTSQISHDEILGLAVFSSVISEDICDYGRSHLWIFNNLNGGLDKLPSAWIGRFPTLVAYIYSRAGKTTWNPIWHIGVILEFLLANHFTPLGDTSGRCRRMILADHFYREGFLPLKWAARKYLERLQRQYGTVGSLYAIYFPNHPLATYTQDLKFIEENK